MQEVNAKKWVQIFLFISALFIGLVGCTNFLIDPYGINHFIKIKRINFYKKSNTGYAFRFKSNILKKSKFDTLMLGTSRVEVMNPDVVNAILDGNTFNFGSSGSITQIHKELFFYTLKNHNIKNVIYGIDFLSLNGAILLEKKFKEFCNIQEKFKNNEDIYNYDLYFNLKTLVDSYHVFLSNVKGEKLLEKKYLYKNGMRDYIDYIDELKRGKFKIDKEIKYSIKSYYSPKRKGGYQHYKFSHKYLLYVKEIVDYCKQHNIKIWVYIPPMYKDHLNALKAYGIYDKFEQFKIELVKIINYYDFSNINSITKRKESFWEGSHLRKEFTPLVMGRVLGDKSINIPDDFGIYITPKNIKEYLKESRKKIQDYDLNKTIDGLL